MGEAKADITGRTNKADLGATVRSLTHDLNPARWLLGIPDVRAEARGTGRDPDICTFSGSVK